MNKEIIFASIGLIITVVNSVLYLRGILRGEILPHPFTMFIWGIVLLISASELVQNNEIMSSIPILVLTVGIIFACGVGIYRWRLLHINWLDYVFLILGIFLIIFWQLEPNYGYVVMVMIGIDAFAYAASFKKVWLQPMSENSYNYAISVINNLCTIFAIYVWSFENLAMWIWTAAINATFAGFIFMRKRQYLRNKKIL